MLPVAALDLVLVGLAVPDVVVAEPVSRVTESVIEVGSLVSVDSMVNGVVMDCSIGFGAEKVEDVSADTWSTAEESDRASAVVAKDFIVTTVR